MNNENLVNSIKSIEMPKDMQHRIIRKCHYEKEILEMKKNKTTTFFRKPIVITVAILLCVCFASVTVLASSGKIQGYFVDIKNITGAVTDTAYEQATDEIYVSVTNTSDNLEIEITLLNIEQAPYNCFTSFGINNYRILDSHGKTLVKNKSTDFVGIIGNKAEIDIPISDLDNGTYTLEISEFSGSAKADQPLVLSGNWKTEFTK